MPNLIDVCERRAANSMWQYRHAGSKFNVARLWAGEAKRAAAAVPIGATCWRGVAAVCVSSMSSCSTSGHVYSSRPARVDRDAMFPSEAWRDQVCGNGVEVFELMGRKELTGHHSMIALTLASAGRRQAVLA